MSKSWPKKLFSLLLPFCLVLTMLPLSATPVLAANPPAASVIVNFNQELNSAYPYLVNGVRSSTGSLGAGGCTAHFSGGTLRLANYNGGTIRGANTAAPADLTIIGQSGTNRVEFSQAQGNVHGIVGSEKGGNINIAGGNLSIKIWLTSTNIGRIYGIMTTTPEAYNTAPGKLTISGDAQVSVIVRHQGTALYNDAYGFFVKEGVEVLDSASLTVRAQVNATAGNNGAAATGIYYTNHLNFNTTGDVSIETTDNVGYGSPLSAGSLTLTRVNKLTIKWTGNDSYLPAKENWNWNPAQYDFDDSVAKTHIFTYLGEPPRITTLSLPKGLVGQSYSAQLSATGKTPISWYVSAGGLPPGLTLSSSGLISGTPTQKGTFTVFFTAQNSIGNSSPKRINIEVNEAPYIPYTNLAMGGVGVPYEETLTAYGSTPITWSLVSGSSLPPGLTLNATTGVISGTPTEMGNYYFTVRARNSYGNDTRELGIEVIIPPTITTESLPDGALGKSYDQRIEVSGSSTYIYREIIAGSLPPGLEIFYLTGRIDGTPLETGTFHFTVKAGSGSLIDTKDLSITIVNPPVITTSSLPSGLKGQYYNQALTANGTAPITWSLASGALPSGVSLEGNAIKGTPTEDGHFTFTVQAANSGAVDTKELTLSVFQQPSITTTELPDGVVDVPYNQALTATGTEPITWSIISGSLPSGLTLSGNTISGVPAEEGSWNFTIKIENAGGSDTRNLSMRILTQAPTPAAIFTATGYDAGQLGNVTNAMQYSVDGGVTWLNIIGNPMTITNVETTTGVQVFQPGDGVATTDSEIQYITVSRHSKPTGVTAVDCTSPANDDGMLLGVTTAMEYRSNDLPWTDGHGEDIEALIPGLYRVRTKASGSALASESITLTVSQYLDILPGVHRWAGSNRYGTAVEISKEGWSQGASTVFLARGDNYADALAGVPLAYFLDAPILLTRTTDLHPAALAEIQRLGAEHVILLGGEGALSAAVKTALEANGLTVERIAGANRYSTAAMVAERLALEGASFSTAFLAVGTEFADALAASSYAAVKGQPILLTQANKLALQTENALNELGITNTIVCGGEGAVSTAVFNQLPNPNRIAGANRYGTALALAEEFLPAESHHLCLATGVDFPDAIAGGVLAAKLNSGVLLVQGKRSAPNQALQDYLTAKAPTSISLLGGGGAISPEIEAWLKNLLD